MNKFMGLQTSLRLDISTVVAKVIVTHLIAGVISITKGDLPSTIIASKRNARLYAQRGLSIFGLRHFDHLVIINANFRILNHPINWWIVPIRKTSLRKAILGNLVFQLFVLCFKSLYSLLHQLQLLFKYLLTIVFWNIAPDELCITVGAHHFDLRALVQKVFSEFIRILELLYT